MLTIIESDRERPKNPAILSEIMQTVRKLEGQSRKPTFNTILADLSAKRVLGFHRTLRKYLDLLLFSGLLSVKYERTAQPNIREKQVYHTVRGHDKPIVEAGEKALLLHGLNWDVPSPMSVVVKIDLKGLALAKVFESKVYASLEDAIVHSFHHAIQKDHRPKRGAEIVVFATALLATKRVDFGYLLFRAREEGVEEEILGILHEIDKTLASAHPNVEDIRTLYELRKMYYPVRPHLLKSIRASGMTEIKNMVTSNEVVEYAGKQLGIRG